VSAIVASDASGCTSIVLQLLRYTLAATMKGLLAAHAEDPRLPHAPRAMGTSL
jgi:hypothetical protein